MDLRDIMETDSSNVGYQLIIDVGIIQMVPCFQLGTSMSGKTINPDGKHKRRN